MHTRRVGRTHVHLSVIGCGTAQLQMVPEAQAVETLVRAFHRGINWVHTAPDYGGIDPWIKKAIDQSGRGVMVVSAGPPLAKDIEAFFEQTCHVYGTRRLSLYGLAGIEDIEHFGENVWGTGGMIAYLQHQKAAGRLGGLYCSTHGPAEYVAKLVKTGVFDAIMLAWNPLGFHQQSHPWARRKIGLDYEDLTEYREQIFPLAAARGVSILAMKPFAGGLLCKSRALPPHDWFADGVAPVKATDVLRLVLEQPGVCSVLPGAASPEEAEENASAGHGRLTVTPAAREHIFQIAAEMRRTLCSRCGKCESSCSRSLPIPALFRDAYIWTTRNETNQANPAENYFDLHPAAELTCSTCVEQTCLCSEGIQIPVALSRVHGRMQQLRETSQHPGPSASFAARTFEGPTTAAGPPIRVLPLTADAPGDMTVGTNGIARFLLQNAGTERWLAPQHTANQQAALGVGVTYDGRLMEVIPLRNTVCPGDVSPVAFQFRAPEAPGPARMRFTLMPLGSTRADEGTLFHERDVVVSTNGHHARQSPPPVRAPLPPPPAYGAEYLEHDFPECLDAGVTRGVTLSLRNTGTTAWAPHHGELAHLEVAVDHVPLGRFPLPAVEVRTGDAVTAHVPFRAHDTPGRHSVVIDVTVPGVGRLSQQGVPPWRIDVTVQACTPTRTVQLFELERAHNPWHYNPFVGIPQSQDGHPFPLFIERAKGSRVWDVEGHEYIDYTMGWGSTILGHADDRVQDAVRRALDSGAVLPLPHPVEMEVSRMLVEDFAPHEMVVFGKNGSDACTLAARFARLATGKRVILSCGFHGWQDFALEYFPFALSGVPYRDAPCFYKFRFNDRAGFLALYEQHRHDLAAVMLEPAGPHLDDQSGLAGEADPGFLEVVADAARRAHALLIFDEIFTGFRHRGGSVQAASGIVPDFLCLGKALASGFPLSALLGPARIMTTHFHKTHYYPTFKSETYSLAAARAALQIYRTEPVIDHLWTAGEALRRGIDQACRDIGVDGGCTGPPYHLAFVFRETDAHRQRLKRTLLMQELIKERVITVTGMMCTSTAHDAPTITRTIEAFAHALDVVAHADRRNALDRHIDTVVF